jgi:nitrogen regulatory protein P-II 2
MDEVMDKHAKKLLVIFAEAALEKALMRDAAQLGAQGCTVADVRGRGHSGLREGAWEADRTIEMKIICDAGVADHIAEYVLAQYAPHYAVSMYFADVQVLRPARF